MKAWSIVSYLVIGIVIGIFLGIILQKSTQVNQLLRRYGILSTSSIKHNQSKPVPANFQGKMSLFILAGQSNMSGSGPLTPASSVTHPRVFVFGNDYRWHLGSEPIDSPSGQVDHVC